MDAPSQDLDRARHRRLARPGGEGGAGRRVARARGRPGPAAERGSDGGAPRAGAVPPPPARGLWRRGDDAAGLPARDRGNRPARRQRRLVRRPRQWLRFARRVSRAGPGAGDLGARPVRRARLGARQGGGSPGRGRLQRHRPHRLRERQPPRDLARRPLHGDRERRLSQAGRQRRAGDPFGSDPRRYRRAVG